MRYAITGASRGLGLEFVRQLLNRGDSIDAGVRSPAEAQQLQGLVREAGGRLRVHGLNVSDPKSVDAFAAAVEQGEPLDVLINNAGVYGKDGTLTGLDYASMADTFAVNTLGPLRLTAALLPALRRGSARRIIHISSQMGSIGENGMGGSYGYRISKAAMNMAMRNMHLELRAEGFVTISLHPGWVQTDMGGPQAPLRPEESVRGMINVIDRLKAEDGGRFFSHEGQELPW
ncbi:SDR family oxidoreductase [Vitiosangium sp. GDMCC 1.1324]|uniref:SDR family oxidoreductase n=1 Tax=Vitiosangium sp. (strain GDMCC 1.1324) TaxID=2138576 RepID=UPI000D3875DE|nr:SDR family oxidoreductase [Vitiosangium sp. GDMCC 1.1324]PTL82305.1 SDR family oxidoreductase [Vitiosangium sp. GDMCC 1.1324]